MMHAQDARPPEYWLSLADEALKAAERFGDAECKRMMYTVAAAYKRIADAAPRLQQVGELADELVPEALETDPNVRGAELAERARAAASARNA